MLDDFLIRAALAGLGLAIAAAPLGCFVAWRRMAYFGDATAHAAILGVALSLALSLPVVVGTLAVVLVMAALVYALSERGLAMDTVLGVLAHSALAFGLVAVTFVPGVRLDLSAYLFGDILAVSKSDLAVIWTGAVAVVALVVWRWQALLTATVSPDLAWASGLDPRRESRILTLALAVVVAVAIKVVGALLVSAMLLIPAAAARPLARSPESMAVIAAGVAVLAALGGLWGAFLFDTPAGPSMVCAAAVIFGGTTLVQRLRG
ncbi:hypothetical protein HC022_10920 [Salipiger sp. HF18]|uniref:metal ABC transporter permease n=1 Tax=Salipiger sp. HF18 TaxID=2721557 RepID=UPI00142D886C|nr:metal ABC transporter permease [Salipiger sp. HF18]NIY96736.1 hypothetical protein [Salipiger sp. HF18]